MINNKAQLIGRLGKDIEIKVAGEHKVAQISLAVRKNKDESEWFYVNVWDHEADYLDRFAKKGSLIAVNGRLTMRNYQDRQGNNHNQMQFNATEVLILDNWKKAEEKEIVIEDEELPFY